MLSSSLVAGRVPSQDSAIPELNLERLPASVRTDLQKAYANALESPSNAGVVGHLGMMLHAYDQHRSAMVCYRLAHVLEPGALSWAYLLGLEAAATGDDLGAARSLRAALTIDPEFLPARIRLAETLLTTGDFEGSLEQYALLARDVPELAVAQYGLGRLSALQRGPKAAIEHYRRAVEISPQFGTAHYALALAYRDAALEELAERHVAEFRRWGARRPEPPDPILDSVTALRQTARTLLVNAAQLASKGEIQEAIDLHLKALEMDASVAQIHVNLISLYGRLGRFAEADSHYRAALSLHGSEADAHYNYGVLLIATTRQGDAVEAFRKALAVNPFHAPAHNNLAMLLAASGSLEVAVPHYRQAIANDPTHRSARFHLVLTLIKLGRLPEAVEQSERLPSAGKSDSARLWFALSRAWFTVNDGSRARACAEQALQRARTAGQTELTAEIERYLARMTTAG